MPALTSLTVNDRETTPVAHIFAPFSRKSPNAVVLREAGAVPAADKFVELSSETLRDGSLRETLKLTVPTVQTETINGITAVKVIRQAMGKFELRFSSQSTVQERKNVLGMLANALLATQPVVNDAFVNGEGWY